MKILVDVLPTKADDCIFVIKNNLDENVPPACSFRASGSISFSYTEDGSGCRLCFGEACPYLRKHMYD